MGLAAKSYRTLACFTGKVHLRWSATRRGQPYPYETIRIDTVEMLAEDFP